MVEEEPQRGLPGMKGQRRLKMTMFEQAIIAAMLLALGIASIDAVNGQHLGKGDALKLAKLQGQQELMASRLK